MCLARRGGKMARHVFLTGPPGIGKTTLIHKTIDVLKSSGVPLDGFYTEEVRKDRRRIGFDVVTVSGKRGPLSRTSCDSGSLNRRCEYRVGQYAVDIPSFECLVLPLLRKVSDRNDTEKRVYVIDEIGKMELFSEPFIQSVRQILDGPGGTILGTIPIPKGKPLELVEEIRSRKDVKIFNISKDNRNNIVREIVATVQDCRELNRN
ncbi:cancer-related nucleoside-triphosphatase isoform X2 [Stegostoma tigrinum]|uniref:cancer-related nucleoside-triphosphatase isoform X2 n=1 Tax=Stegostoma tigrinum TaxID=3053191 RepID=UPI00202B3028|nr:cancer-related nucleoside-triphosphatase isoform X2 [Stegostoma tigrinum]